MHLIKEVSYIISFNFTQQEYDIITNNLKFNLKKQEKIIFEMLCQGYKNQEIAKKLNVSIMTIWRRQKEIIKKIDFYLKEKENIKDLYCVYMHKFPNGKIYIGITSDIEKRWNNGLGYKNNEKMFEDILKYGWDNIEHNIIVEGTTYSEALKIESEKIEEYKSFDEKYGYNIRRK